MKIYATDQAGVGWIPQKMGDRQDIGLIFDFGSYRVIEGKRVVYKLIAQEVLADQELRDWALEHDHPFYEVPEHFLLKLPVYNLEVEDFHTYYVGEYGVWVHNQNCGGLSFERPKGVRAKRGQGRFSHPRLPAFVSGSCHWMPRWSISNRKGFL